MYLWCSCALSMAVRPLLFQWNSKQPCCIVNSLQPLTTELTLARIVSCVSWNLIRSCLRKSRDDWFWNYQNFTSQQHISKTFCNGYSRTLPGFPIFKKQHSKPIRSLQHLACFLLCDVFVRKPHLTHNNEHKYITNRQTVWPLDYICGRGAQTLVVTEHMQIELSM